MAIWLRQAATAKEGLTSVLPDETVSSWVRRHPGVRASDEHGTARPEIDLDLGELVMDLPDVSPALIGQLRDAARPLTGAALPPCDRTLYCKRCLLEDWVSGRPPYWRRRWLLDLATCCPRHGALADTWRAPWKWRVADGLASRPWYQQLAPFAGPNGGRTLNVGGDRRAIGLEAALLAPDTADWFPRDFDPASLPPAYAVLREILARQLGDDVRPFSAWPNPERYAVHVCAEAILACWTRTPLPNALPLRTSLIVRAIGWDIDPPRTVGAHTILLKARGRPPGNDELTAAAVPFPAEVRERVRRAVHHGERNCRFTRPEATLIGLGTQPFDVVAMLCGAGHVGTFDRKRGRLRRNRNSGPVSLDVRERLRRLPLDFPPWVETTWDYTNDPYTGSLWEWSELDAQIQINRDLHLLVGRFANQGEARTLKK